MRVLKNLSLYFLVVLLFVLVQVPGYSYYRYLDYSQLRSSYRELPLWFSNIPLAQYPEKVGSDDLPLITAEGVFVIDVDSAVPIYQKNVNKELFPASTTKIMTALIALEEYRLEDVIEVPEASFSGSLMKLKSHERITVLNLLYGLLINSGNDAADTIAMSYPGGYSAFIDRMNTRGVELGLKSTHFTNPSGLPDQNHKMSAWDLGQLAAFALRNDTFKSIVNTREKIVYGLNGERHVLMSTNKLLGEVRGLDGIKTGYTEDAGEVLVSTVERNGHRIVTVLLKSSDRFGETKNVVEWVFRNYEWRTIQ
ncbi:MAG: D-alanyl-D-alanine carboxypeptidase [bacterium]|nr:D-alanyl-D-alanine carboxypeptidase [bacterium]